MNTFFVIKSMAEIRQDTRSYTLTKIRHRADFGISVDRQYWNLGIGTALMNACIECAGTSESEQR